MKKIEYSNTTGFNRHAKLDGQKIENGDVLCLKWPDGHDQITKVRVAKKNAQVRGSVTFYDEVPYIKIRHRGIETEIELPDGIEASFFSDTVPKWVKHISMWEDALLLPEEQIVEVLKTRDPGSYIIASRVPIRRNGVIVWLGNGRKLEIPRSFFKVGGCGTKPDFDDVQPTDWGGALRLGDYEVGTDSILQFFS